MENSRQDDVEDNKIFFNKTVVGCVTVKRARNVLCVLGPNLVFCSLLKGMALSYFDPALAHVTTFIRDEASF